MRTFILIMAIAVISLAAGALAMRANLNAEIAAANGARKAIESTFTDITVENARLKKQIEELAAQNATLEQQRLEAAANTMVAVAAPEPAFQNPFDVKGGDLALQPPPEEKSREEPAPREDRRRDWREGRQGREGRGGDWAEWANLTEEERQQRRQERFNEVRNRVNDFFLDEWEKTTDASAKARLTSMSEQTNYMMDLFQEMRNAESDEEREAIRAEIEMTRENLRTLSEEQRASMLRDVAREFGITDPAKQEAFIESLQATQENPLYRGGMGMFGGRGGFGGGPPGGGFGGGGFGGGGPGGPPPGP